MEALIIILVIFIVFLTVISAITIFRILNTFGTLIVDTSDPNKDIFRIELDMDLEKVKWKDFVILKVNRKTKKTVINIDKNQEE